MEMAKRKMAEWMRDKLVCHVKRTVDPQAERKAMDVAYKKVAPMVTKVVVKKYKPADMDVLAKYDLTYLDGCIRLTLSDSRVEEFDYRDGEGVRVPNHNCHSRMFLADEPLTEAFDAYSKAKQAHEVERERRIEAYRTLIRSAAFVEDLIEMWPEAATLLPASAMVAQLTPEQMALVQADTHERKAA
jgi:hypothetical protein